MSVYSRLCKLRNTKLTGKSTGNSGGRSPINIYIIYQWLNSWFGIESSGVFLFKVIVVTFGTCSSRRYLSSVFRLVAKSSRGVASSSLVISSMFNPKTIESRDPIRSKISARKKREKEKLLNATANNFTIYVCNIKQKGTLFLMQEKMRG